MSKPPNGSSFTEVGKSTVEMFSEDRIALNREVLNHPALIMSIRVEAPSGEEGEVIGVIAAYCNVRMDGAYQREEIERLYPILVGKLMQIRKIIIH